MKDKQVESSCLLLECASAHCTDEEILLHQCTVMATPPLLVQFKGTFLTMETVFSRWFHCRNIPVGVLVFDRNLFLLIL